MTGPSPSESSRQLTLPECSIKKTRRRRGRPCRRQRTTSALTVRELPDDVVEILHALAKRQGVRYDRLCAAVLIDYAYTAVNPRARRR